MVLDIIPAVANISFVVSIIFFFFSLIQLIYKESLPSHFFLSVTFFATAVQCLSFWLYFRDSPIFERYFYYSDSAFLFLIGPFLSLFFIYITEDSPLPAKRIWLNSVPFILTLIIIEGINLSVPVLELKMGLAVFELITSLSYLSLLVYLILISRTLSFYYREKNQSPEVKALLYTNVCSIVFSIILLLSRILGSELQLIGHIAFFCIPLMFIFFLIRYPDFFSRAQRESQEIRYLNSQLKGIDKNQVIGRLHSLMNEERIYRDNKLTLKELSEKLFISPSQLSELLNSHFDSSFNNYINSHRIEEVKQRLAEKHDLNILQIAIDCGFNSKTTFNTAFKKFTGLTPTRFRENNLNSSSVDRTV